MWYKKAQQQIADDSQKVNLSRGTLLWASGKLHWNPLQFEVNPKGNWMDEQLGVTPRRAVGIQKWYTLGHPGNYVSPHVEQEVQQLVERAGSGVLPEYEGQWINLNRL